MAFKRLVDCDKSDVSLWAGSNPAKNFLKEIEDVRDVALRDVIRKDSKNREESAAIVRSFDLIIGLFKEARNL